MEVPMIALARQNYAGQALKTGDPFNAASELEADDLIAVRMASRAKPKATAKTADAVLAGASTIGRAATPTVAGAGRGNDGYARRDMRPTKR